MPNDAYLTLAIPDDERVGAIAREAALDDFALASMGRELARADLDPGVAAALALTVARAGWAEGRAAIRAQRARRSAGHSAEARALGLAEALCDLRPPGTVEAAESGYRYVDPEGALYIEDPVAAHWHHQGRWGPPLRPRVERAGRHASGPGGIARWLDWAGDGGIVVVTFEPSVARARPPLRLCRAGFARDRALNTLVRWSSLRSIGRMQRRPFDVVAYQQAGGAPVALPDKPSIPVDSLLRLMEALSALGRGGAPSL